MSDNIKGKLDRYAVFCIDAYGVAVKNGFKGTAAEWLESLQGKDGVTPHIGDNGNWFIGDFDTGQTSQAIATFDDVVAAVEMHFADNPDAASLIGFAKELWVLENFQPVGEYLTAVPAGYATEEFVSAKIADAQLRGEEVDLSAYAKKSELPTKVSQLINDKGYLTEHQDISGKLDASALPEAINTALAQAKESGEFKGDKGDPGKTPVKGVDYFSPDDVAEMVSSVLAALDIAEEASF